MRQSLTYTQIFAHMIQAEMEKGESRTSKSIKPKSHSHQNSHGFHGISYNAVHPEFGEWEIVDAVDFNIAKHLVCNLRDYEMRCVCCIVSITVDTDDVSYFVKGPLQQRRRR